MSLLGLASKAVGIINALQSNLESNMDLECAGLLQDANRFILKNVQVINKAPLQVYCSALVFAPRSSTIRRLFNSQRSSWISVLPQVEESWGTEPQILKGHSELVSSVAFSRDGQRIISGSYDKSIKLWDAQTGLGLQTHNYSCPIWSVAFSLDGQRIISCYSDDTIKVWDAQTGSELQTVEGDCGWVESVAFSPERPPSPHKSDFQISLENDWVKFGGEKVLWLPRKYREYVCSAITDDTVVFGYKDGRVFIVKFCAPLG